MDWNQQDEAISRTFVFADFAAAVAFVVRVGFAAEAADHHPDISIERYKRVTLKFTTHSAGKLTQKDWDGAKAADEIAAAMGGR